jgi:tellurite resistance protein TerC
MILEALHTNTLPFINGGEHLNVPTIGIPLSLSVIIGVLVITAVASLAKTRRDDRKAVAEESSDGETDRSPVEAGDTTADPRGR